MLTREEAKKLAEKVLGYSTFPECSVSITSSEQAFTRFANNGITTAALVNRHSVSIASTRDGRSGRHRGERSGRRRVASGGEAVRRAGCDLRHRIRSTGRR